MFICIALCFSFTSFISVDITRKANIENSRAADRLSSACMDASGTMNTGNIERYGCVWNDEKDLTDTLNMFYTSLVHAFYLEPAGREDEMVLFTPVVCLVDINGFYISHNVVFDKTGMVSISSQAEKRNGLTTLNTWTENVGSMVLRYYLNDYVEVYTNAGKTYSGDRKEVYIEILEKEHSRAAEVDFIVDDDRFNERKNQVIIGSINKQCEYYINRHNVIGDSHINKYKFNMPEIKGEEWARLLENPTIISFLQGYSSKADNRPLNVYAFAGGELVQNYHYFIVDDGHGGEYHCIESDPDVVETTKTETISYESGGKTKTKTTTYVVYTYDGTVIDTIYNSQAECAKRGATPHKCVYEWSY
jgi:hypothetical protein